jgi:8-oxoguanine deaminase
VPAAPALPLPQLQYDFGIWYLQDLGFDGGWVEIGLGVDGSASNDHSNLILETRQALLLQRLHYGSDRVSIQNALRWATSSGAHAINRPELGQIQVGNQADLAFFKVDGIQHSGHHDPLASLLLSGTDRAEHVLLFRVNGGYAAAS